MARKATSPEEMDQVARVHALLGDIRVAPPPRVSVTLANGKTHAGELVRLRVSNTPKKDGSWSAGGVITLWTGEQNVEIDYLDIVTAQQDSKKSVG